MSEELIIIGAGVKDARKIENQYQMFLEVDGRKCFQIILDEVVKLANDMPVYLWGSEEILGDLLKPIVFREKNRREVVLVPEKRSPIESLVFTYLEYLRNHDREFRRLSSGWESFEDIEWEKLPGASGKDDLSKTVFYLPCDIPLVAKEEIEFLIKNHDRAYALQMGWTLRDGFEKVIDSLCRSGVSFDRIKSKMNFSHFMSGRQPVECRFNNFYCGKPGRLDPNIYLFFKGLYDSRELIRKESRRGAEKRSINPLRFLMMLRFFLRYLGARKKEAGNKVFGCGSFIFHTYLNSLGLTGGNYPGLKRLAHLPGSEKRYPPAVCLDLGSIERNLEKLTGNRIGMFLSNVVGPLFDVDTEYEYGFIKSHYLLLRDEIAKYYVEKGMLPGGRLLAQALGIKAG